MSLTDEVGYEPRTRLEVDETTPEVPLAPPPGYKGQPLPEARAVTIPPAVEDLLENLAQREAAIIQKAVMEHFDRITADLLEPVSVYMEGLKWGAGIAGGAGLLYLIVSSDHTFGLVLSAIVVIGALGWRLIDALKEEPRQ